MSYIDPTEVAQLCYDEGWRDRNLVIMVAIVGASSAFNNKATTGVEHGLFMLNESHMKEWGYVNLDSFIEMVQDPAKAAFRARALFEKRHFQPWERYRDGGYKDWLKEALVGYSKVLFRSFGLEL